MNNSKTELVAKAVLQRPNGDILLLRRHRLCHRRPGEWDFPGGKVDLHEDINEAVCREIHEETSLIVQKIDAQLVYADTRMEQWGNACRLYYTAPTIDGPIVLNEREHEEYIWLTLDAAIELHDHPIQGAFLVYLLKNNLLPQK